MKRFIRYETIQRKAVEHTLKNVEKTYLHCSYCPKALCESLYEMLPQYSQLKMTVGDRFHAQGGMHIHFTHLNR